MSDQLTLDAVTSQLADEGEPTLLDDFNEEVSGGAWPKGWYPAEVIEGFQTSKGKQMATGDAPSQKGDSRNALVCVRVSKGDQERTTFDQINYRESDFGADRQAYVAQARKEHKGTQGRWNDDPDAQRSSLALVKVTRLAKAVGFSIIDSSKHIAPARLVGQKVDAHLTINKEGYNEINDYAPAGTKVGKKS